jgi:general secretion pathway protein G
MQTSPSIRARRPADRRAGFTLIEIMVVVVIIGLLATLVGPQVMGLFGDAQVTKAQSDVKQFADQLMYQRMQNARNASEPSLEKLVTPDEKGRTLVPGGLEALKDPWGNDYQIAPGEQASKFVVLSMGPDRTQGTEDDIRSAEF